MGYKKYEIEHDEGLITSLSIKDLSDFFYQTRGFPSILTLGSLNGEGQSGGRFISDIAKELERLIILDIGRDKYIKQMNKLMGND